MKTSVLSKQDIKTLLLSAFGGMLEFYDFVVFIFFAKIIGEHFFPPSLSSFWTSINTYGTFAIGFFVRPIGGIIMAHFGDLFGRKKMFFLSIILMVFPTLALGFLPTYFQIGYFAPIFLLIIRILQGFAIGGEIPSAWVFVAEHVPKNKIGIAVAMITSSLSLGVLLGSSITFYINTYFSTQEIYSFAWRYPFILGGMFGIISVFLRKWLKETPVFIEMKNKKELSRKMPLQRILQFHRHDIAFSVLLTWIFTGCSILLMLIVPNLMSDYYNIPKKEAITMQGWALISLSFGTLLGGLMCDKKEVEQILILCCLSFAISSGLFLEELIMMKSNVAILYTITGLFAGGMLGCISYILVGIFPASIRISGISFSYNLGQAVFGGITPIMTIWMVKKYPEGILYYVIFLSFLGMCSGCYLLFRKKKGD